MSSRLDFGFRNVRVVVSSFHAFGAQDHVARYGELHCERSKGARQSPFPRPESRKPLEIATLVRLWRGASRLAITPLGLFAMKIPPPAGFNAQGRGETRRRNKLTRELFGDILN